LGCVFLLQKTPPPVAFPFSFGGNDEVSVVVSFLRCLFCRLWCKQTKDERDSQE